MVEMTLTKFAVSFEKIGIGPIWLKDGFSVFGIEISLFGVFLLFAFMCGIQTIFLLSRKTDRDFETFLAAAPGVLLIGMIGARVGYVALHWSYYKVHPSEIFSFRSDGMLIIGALLFAYVAIYFSCKERNLDVYEVMDIVSPALLTGQIVNRIGNFFTGDMLGTEWKGFLSMHVVKNDVDVYCHPVFLYEIILDVFLLNYLIKSFNQDKRDGFVFSAYLIGVGFIRLITETFREDHVNITKHIYVSHIIALIIMLLGIRRMVIIYKEKKII